MTSKFVNHNSMFKSFPSYQIIFQSCLPCNNSEQKPATTITMNLQISIFLLAFWSMFLLCKLFPEHNTKTTEIEIQSVSDQTDHHHNHDQRQKPPTLIQPKPQIPPCNPNSLVYIYDLPPKFNHDILKDCLHLNLRTNMCRYIIHRGLGPPLPITSTTWFATNQFTAELIFHARLENHHCRTHNPNLARLFYVPFYGGFHASSHTHVKNLTKRNALILDLSHHLLNNRWWQRNHGRDHFMALGRTSWDFMSAVLKPTSPFPASNLLTFPVIKNMSFLPVERHPWKGGNQFSIPYPSYFHPCTSKQLTAWQKHIINLDRPHLYSFIGSTRRGKSRNALVRNEIVRECQKSSNCKLLDCSVKGVGEESICHDPSRILGVMTRSKFCLHPPGDSFTRRSIFDSFLAGCVPVFFSKHSAYDQYRWYLPTNGSLYSVLIDKGKNVEEVLGNITETVTMELRKRVVALLPKVTYIHPNGSDWGMRDAVDVALEALSKQALGSRKSVSSI